MPLSQQNQRTFHRHLYSEQIKAAGKVTLLKRGDDQREGIITKYCLFEAWWSSIHKTGEAIQGDMSSDHRRTIHLARIELDRIGVQYINTLDTFIDREGRWWRPESNTRIDVKLFEDQVRVDCLRIDPPVIENPPFVARVG